MAEAGAQGSIDRVRLCATCHHALRVTTARGSTFYRCALAAEDARFPKYPPAGDGAMDGATAPLESASVGYPPITAVLPSADRATDRPYSGILSLPFDQLRPLLHELSSRHVR